MSNIGATTCQFLRLKCTKCAFRRGSAPDSTGGAYSTPPDPLAVLLRGVRERRGMGKGMRRKGKGERRGEEGGGGIWPTQQLWRGAPMAQTTLWKNEVTQPIA